jgi:hypothetical protein
MGKYFDAFVYVANWGTHEFMLRLPIKTLERREYAPFCTGRCLRARVAEERLVLSFRAEELKVDWEEGQGWMDSLLPLRAGLLRGDLRPLYLGWLLAVQHSKVADDHPEPRIPAGLRNLSEPLNRLAKFLGIDPDLLAAAAEASADLGSASPSQDALARWVAGLPQCEKDALLLQVAAGENPHAGADLLRRFQSSLPAAPANVPAAPRTAGQLRGAAEMRSRERARREERRQKLERAREAQRKAAERTKYLDALEQREEAGWADLDASARVPGSLRKGFWLSFCTSSRIASFNSARLKNWRLRSTASTQRSASKTPCSTFALSRGLRGRAGTTATPLCVAQS